MPRRHNRRSQPRPRHTQIPGYIQDGSHGRSTLHETWRLDPNGKSSTRHRYLQTGLGRSLSTDTVGGLLELLGLPEAEKIGQSGIAYVAGNEMAKLVQYGFMLGGASRLEPHDAVNALYEGVLVSGGVITERDEFVVACKGFGVKQFGSSVLKIVAHLSDVSNEEGEPIILDERIRAMELLGVDQVPSRKPFDLITHNADLALTDEVSFDDAKSMVNDANATASHLDVTLLPVSAVTTVLPGR